MNASNGSIYNCQTLKERSTSNGAKLARYADREGRHWTSSVMRPVWRGAFRQLKFHNLGQRWQLRYRHLRDGYRKTGHVLTAVAALETLRHTYWQRRGNSNGAGGALRPARHKALRFFLWPRGHPDSLSAPNSLGAGELIGRRRGILDAEK